MLVKLSNVFFSMEHPNYGQINLINFYYKMRSMKNKPEETLLKMFLKQLTARIITDSNPFTPFFRIILIVISIDVFYKLLNPRTVTDIQRII